MKTIWFRRKSFGWGWQPVTWQGWVIMVVYLVVIMKAFFIANMNAHSGSDALIGFALPFIIFTTILIVICYKKGEKPRWQWGKRIIDKNE